MMPTTPQQRIAAALALMAGATLTGCGSETADVGNQPELYTVARGDLQIAVQEMGEIKALRETRVRSQVEGQATIIYLVEEGVRVEKGEKLVELDASSLEDREANQAIDVERAQAALVNAQQNVDILEKELEAEEASARSKLEIAEINLEKYLGRAREAKFDEASANAAEHEGTNREMLIALQQLVSESPQHAHLPDAVINLLGTENLEREMGDMAQKVLDQIDQIRLARADLKLKEDTLGHSERLAKKDYITRNELEKHKLDYDSQQSRVSLAWNELDLLVHYGLKSEKIDLELKVDNARLDLAKVLASANARRAREQADLRSNQSSYDLASERLDNLREQIKNAVIYAPTPGLVVYAQVGDGRRSNEVVEEGIEVRQRQSLIILPDVTKMIATLKVPEADIDKVVVGQPATIEVDAFPDTPFVGKVTRVSPLPDSGSRWSNNSKKVYKTEVTLEGTNEVLRPGMSSSVEILVGRVQAVLSVPLPAVRRQLAVHYVWKKTPTGPVATKVEVGRVNLTHVEIKSGVGEGEQVYLTPPPGQTAPEFEQPEGAVEAPEPPDEDEVRKQREEQQKRGSGGEGNRRRGGGGGSSEFTKKVKAKFPQFADRMNGMWFRDQEIMDAVKADPELNAELEQMMQRMRSGGGFGGSRGGGRGGPRPNDGK